MIPISRRKLDADVIAELARLQRMVDRATDPADQAKRRWNSFSGTKTKTEVSTGLKAMCSGIERCMYCEDSAGTDIEHFRPKSSFPAMAFVWENYLFACSHCNSNEKRNHFPIDEMGRALLIDPTTMDPFDHLALSVGSGLYVGLDAIGQTSIDVFGLNREVCSKGRRRAWSV
ncbi:hypothetical protein, partial [Nocardia sp. NPDC058497]|uniref:hypothetical protein n=1 Tax=Nocardia sp. NPDC058497 TaxID=3346529 RepID=UPI00365029A6